MFDANEILNQNMKEQVNLVQNMMEDMRRQMQNMMSQMNIKLQFTSTPLAHI